jgi:hypothetical protein
MDEIPNTNNKTYDYIEHKTGTSYSKSEKNTKTLYLVYNTKDEVSNSMYLEYKFNKSIGFQLDQNGFL